MKKYVSPEMEFTVLNTRDIVTVSDGGANGEAEVQDWNMGITQSVNI